MPKKPPGKAAAQFSKRLLAMREAKGLGASQLADLAGVHRQTIYKIESGQVQPTWDTAVALADALAVSTEDFRREADRHETQAGAAIAEMQDWLKAAPLGARKGRRKG